MKHKRPLGTPRLLGIVWPFIAVVLFQALLGCLSLYMLSAVRGYVAGESLWSKGQKDAIYYLHLYADNRDPAVFEKYLQAIKVPQGGHRLRMALDQYLQTLPRRARAFCKGVIALRMSRALSGFIVISMISAICAQPLRSGVWVINT